MGGGVSRLDETVWEAPSIEAEPSTTGASDSFHSGVTNNPCVADGGLESSHQTVDGSLPTEIYRNLEVRKARGVGQRDFEIVDSRTQELVLLTRAVPGTLCWFDVLGPGSCGDYVDTRLRVCTRDSWKRTWIVYTIHRPVFANQHPIDPHTEPEAHAGLPPGTRLYKTACATVSLSRYVIVAARYGPPNALDLGDEVEEDGAEDQETETDPSEANDSQESSARGAATRGAGGVSASDRGSSDTKEHPAVHDDDEDEEFITPKELLLRQQQQQRLRVAATALFGGGVEESKDEAADEDSDSEDEADNLPEAAGTFPERFPPRDSAASLSRRQTEELRRYLGDASGNSLPPPPATLTSRVVQHSTTLVQHGAHRLSQSVRSVSLAAAGRIRSSLVQGGGVDDPDDPNAAIDQGSGDNDDEEDSSERLMHPEKAETVVISNLEDDGSNRNEEIANNNRVGAQESISQTRADHPPALSPEEQDAMDRLTHRERAREGVIDLDGDHSILECQEISNKMMGNHQTFYLKKHDLLTLLKLEQQQRHPTTEIPQEAGSRNEIDASHQQGHGSWLAKLQAAAPKPSEARAKSSEALAKLGGMGVAAKNKLVPYAHDAKNKLTPYAQDAKNKLTPYAQDARNKLASHAHRALGGGGGLMGSGWKWMAGSAETDSAGLASASTDAMSRGGPLETQSGIDTTTTIKAENNADENDANRTEHSENNLESYKASRPSHSVEAEDVISPGDGIEESKEEVFDRSEPNTPTGTGVGRKDLESLRATEPPEEETEASPPPPPPLVSYFYWQHTSLDLRQHKMHLHLAQRSDLALHVLLAVIANQVRSERNHAVLLATGIHPSWLYLLDPKTKKKHAPETPTVE